MGIDRRSGPRPVLGRSRRALSRGHRVQLRNSVCVMSKKCSKVAFWGCIVVIGRFLLRVGLWGLQESLKVVPF